MRQSLIVLAAASVLAASITGSVFAEGDAANGERLFNRCSGCHTVDGQNRAGPALDGVFGRTAGTVEGFRYSTALVESNIVWDEEALDTYLSGPTSMVRGTRMTAHLTDPEDRADIIAYLRSLNAQ